MQPWNGHTLVGTTDSIYKGDPSGFKIGLNEIKEFLAELNEAYPSEMFSPINVKYAFGGLRPIDPGLRKKIEQGVSRDGMVNTSRDEDVIDHSKDFWGGLNKIENLISVVGIKYTTFRSVGEKAIKLLNNRSFGHKHFEFKSGGSKKVSFIGDGELPSLEKLMGFCMEQGFSCKSSSLVNTIMEYGANSKFIIQNAISQVRNLKVDPESGILRSRIEFACKYEHAKTLSDILVRRLSMTSLGFPGHPVVDEISHIVAAQFGWTEEKRLAEIKSVNEQFTFSA